jgi:hypothetical protein
MTWNENDAQETKEKDRNRAVKAPLDEMQTAAEGRERE